MSEQTNMDRAMFIDIATDSYKRVGEGVTAITPALNPATDQKHYVNAKNPTTKVTAFSRQYALTMERYKGDDANDYIAGLAGKLGDDIKTSILIVEMSEATAETRPAVKYDATVVVENDGTIAGGGAMDMGVTIYVNGDGVKGTFKESDSSFTKTV